MRFKVWMEILGYHGTQGPEFDSFNPKKIGKGHRTSLSKLGFFFSPDEASAGIYAGRFRPGDTSGSVTRWKLDIKNPYHMSTEEFNELIDWGSLPQQLHKTHAAASKATLKKRQELEAAGYDGVYIYNRNGTIAEIVIFHPQQAKKIQRNPDTQK